MSKKYLSIFFTVIFMAFTVVPSVLIMVDNSIDISVLMNISEEEEERKDKNKEIEVFAAENEIDTSLFSNLEREDNLEYKNKKYPKPHLNLISPPPEFI